MNSYYVALIEFHNDTKEKDGERFAAAMNELKAAGKVIGNVTYYRVLDESQYRKAEQEFKQQVGQ